MTTDKTKQTYIAALYGITTEQQKELCKTINRVWRYIQYDIIIDDSEPLDPQIIEGCVIELLDQLYMSGCDDESCLQKDAIMTYLHTQGANMEKTYLFTVTLQGSGDTPEDAWEDAVEAFFEDPGEPHAIEEVEEETEIDKPMQHKSK